MRVSSEHDDTISARDSAVRSAHLGQLATGQIFAGRYEVEAPVGRGGMGAVYRVRDRKLDDVVALKLLTLDTEQAVERFQREVRLARRVTHPNVARTHDLGEHDGVHFLTMEYIRGRALDDILAEAGRLDPMRAAKIGLSIAAGLSAAHEAGVIHRDLKPANVLIGEDGRVVLTDFGIARAALADARTHQTGTFLGTPHYMSPEQVMGGAIDGRSDIYALGLILFELVTGKLPFEAESALAVAVMRMHQAPPDPRTLAPMPDSIAELILRCLERVPEQRVQSAADAHGALSALAYGTKPPSTGFGTGEITPSGMSLYAPMSPGRRAVAVLPFVYRGDAEHDYLGEGLAEELIDVLSQTKGLRVLALGATKRFAGQRDPSRIGIELNADAVVDGTVQISRDRVRIAARLLDTDSGVQRWSDRFDGRFEDVFALQETMGRRVAESLRLEIDAAAHRRTAPQEAIELYLQARRKIRRDVMNRGEEAVKMLDRVLELAPAFTLAYPAHAMASVRAWWSGTPTDAQERSQRARESVARAVERAPDLAETHLVRGMLATQDGSYREAAQALAKAIEIAPTMAEAHQCLGDLQLEAGRIKEGAKRVKLSIELDPTLVVGYFALARVAALEGDWDKNEQYLAKLEEEVATPSLAMLSARLRYALWLGQHDRVREAITILSKMPGFAPERMAIAGKVALGELPIEAAQTTFDVDMPRAITNQRFATLILQIGVEVYCAAGADERALELLTRAADLILFDVGWMRGCPLLARFRDNDVYKSALQKVEERAAAIWRR